MGTPGVMTLRLRTNALDPHFEGTEVESLRTKTHLLLLKLSLFSCSVAFSLLYDGPILEAIKQRTE